MRWSMGRVFGKTLESSTIRNESLFVILQGLKVAPATLPRLLLVTGTEDPALQNGNFARFETTLGTLGVPWDTKLYPGKHDWGFWRAHFAEIVRFHAGRFAASSTVLPE